MKVSRRTFLSHVTGLCLASTAHAIETRLTPRQSLGPFYPRTLPLDSDADLTQVAGKEGQASGAITNLYGQVRDESGDVVPNALIEIWQCDAFGAYHHPLAGGGVDPFFQGYGKAVTDAEGRYRFRTIRPVPYPGRAPHIHVKITHKKQELVTQIYVQGEPANERDFLLNAISDREARNALIIPFDADPAGDSALVAIFNPVIRA